MLSIFCEKHIILDLMTKNMNYLKNHIYFFLDKLRYFTRNKRSTLMMIVFIAINIYNVYIVCTIVQLFKYTGALTRICVKERNEFMVIVVMRDTLIAHSHFLVSVYISASGDESADPRALLRRKTVCI